MLARRVAFLYSLALIFPISVLGLEPAWNGQILPGAVPDSSDPAPFLPYYVPPGQRLSQSSAFNVLNSVKEATPSTIRPHSLLIPQHSDTLFALTQSRAPTTSPILVNQPLSSNFSGVP